MARGRRENLRHPARARADVEQMAEPAVVHHRQHRRLDLALGDVARADRVPFGGMFGEIALGGGDALGADRREPRSEEHTYEPQSLMRIAYSELRLQKKHKIRIILEA